MREIKFKFWLKDDLEMIDDINADMFDINDFFDYCKDENIIPLQYTGMKDKNGVEIYEGYIVCKYFRGGKEGAYRVAFKHGGFMGLSPECDMYGPYTTKLCNLGAALSIRVIGNIHENPELLK